MDIETRFSHKDHRQVKEAIGRFHYLLKKKQVRLMIFTKILNFAFAENVGILNSLKMKSFLFSTLHKMHLIGGWKFKIEQKNLKIQFDLHVISKAESNVVLFDI